MISCSPETDLSPRIHFSEWKGMGRTIFFFLNEDNIYRLNTEIN